MRTLLLLAACLIALVGRAAHAGTVPATKSVAVTIDDLPVQEPDLGIDQARSETAALLAALKRHGVPAIGFVNEDKLLVPNQVSARIGLLEDWLAACMSLGNHGFGHLSFEQTPLAEYEDAVLRGEITLRRLLAARGAVPRFYRYPFNQTGSTPEIRDAFLRFLQAHGYAPAPMTIEDDDSIFAAVYAADRDAGNAAEAEAVSRSYLANLDKALDTFEGMSATLFGRQIPQVLLIHANRLNADTLDRTLDRLSERGYRFISLDAAVSDPAYRSPDGYAGRYGKSWLSRWADGLHRPVHPSGQPDPETWIGARYTQITGKQP